MQSRFPSLSTNTSAGLGSLSSGMNQTPIPEGSQPLAIKPFPISAAVLKLDHSTSSDYLLTILQFFFWGLLDAPLFSLLFSPMGSNTSLVSWLWWFLPICFYVGVHRNNPQLLASMFCYGFLSRCPWLLDHPLLLFPPTFLTPFHISIYQYHLPAHALRNGCSPTYCLQPPVLSHSMHSPGLYPCLYSCLLPAAAFEVTMNKNWMEHTLYTQNTYFRGLFETLGMISGSWHSNGIIMRKCLKCRAYGILGSVSLSGHQNSCPCGNYSFLLGEKYFCELTERKIYDSS